MTNAMKITAEGIDPFIDPTTGSGNIFMLAEAMGQSGRPFAFMVEDPPHKTRPRHYHHGDVIYVYVQGEHVIEGEGTYRAGDIRWTKAGHTYGPETTGSEGGAWWVISYSDPIPVDMPADKVMTQANGAAIAPRQSTEPGRLPNFDAPYDWKAIDDAVRTVGGAIIKGIVSPDDVQALNIQTDAYLEAHAGIGKPESGSTTYDMFLGQRTTRLHGLAEKIPASAGLIGKPELVDWANRLLGAKCSSIMLNAGELIQIGPGEPAQYLHRDSDSWAQLPIDADTVIVNAIVALDPFTLENGATYIAPESWQWDKHRQPKDGEFARAVMDAGDAILFRGDLLHGGGENASAERRRAISVSYCAGWLRPVENSFLNIDRKTAAKLSSTLQSLLGYAAHDAVKHRGGMLGLYENGDPGKSLNI
jgi:ectoine hydroxylase-related dioxygenase (phytanoyl-CoA dioxygenase family)